jgi:ribosomal-protein-alanine N-acetyltransferase
MSNHAEQIGPVTMQGREAIRTIRTPRLELVPATLDLVQAELRAPEELGSLLTAEVPESWPPELYDRAAAEYTMARLGEGSDQTGWWQHYIVWTSTQSRRRTLIGTCGFKGPPTADGTVEIGYSVLPEFRRRGYATEAAQGLTAHAFAHPVVALVIAETLPDLFPSIGVLRKIGFDHVGEGSEPGVVRYELRRAHTRLF